MKSRCARRQHPCARPLAIVLAVLSATISLLTAAPAGAVEAVADGYSALPAPQRLVDTRPGETTIDGTNAATGKLGAGDTLKVKVSERAGLPESPVAAMLNVTAAEASDPGFITVYPCDQDRPTASSLNYVAGQTVPNAVIATVDPTGSVCFFTLRPVHLIVDVSGWFDTGTYAPLATPRRLLDTRPGQSTADGDMAGGGIRIGGTELVLPVAGRAGIPDDATTVALNVTATEPTSGGFVTVYPCGADTPKASNLNYAPGQTIPNLVVSKLGPNGSVCIFVRSDTHLVVDASGTLPSSSFEPLDAPRRLLDTRPEGTTADGAFRRSGAQPARATLQLHVAGRVGIPKNASAVVLNVTAVAPASPGYLTVHPRGTVRPKASNLNHATGGVIANAVVARVGAGGDLCLFNLGFTDIVVDVTGWLTGPPPPTDGAGCPSLIPTDPGAANALLARPNLHLGVGVDRIAVLACDLPDAEIDVDPVAAAAWANAEVAPWFVEASGGRYRPVFEAHPLGRISRESQSDCVFDGPGVTGEPFTNVLVIDSSSYGGGQASPGLITFVDRSIFADPPNLSRRGAWIGGGSVMIDPSTTIHEIGHTLHWPHSGTSSNAYDNPLDIMSGSPNVIEFFREEYSCEVDGGYFIWCTPQNTLAINRLASGWIDGKQVALHYLGNVNYTLDGPTGSGVQMVAMANPFAFGKFMVAEARPATGRDESLERAGVAIHLIDQRDGAFSGISTQRQQRQAAGEGNDYSHVLAPGESLSVHGITITVLDAVGGGYQIRVVGTYAPPDVLFS